MYLLIQLFCVCRFSAEAVMQRGGTYGPGSGPIWLEDVRCSGNETSFLNCRHKPFGTGNCEHFEDVGVICTSGTLNHFDFSGTCRHTVGAEINKMSKFIINI